MKIISYINSKFVSRRSKWQIRNLLECKLIDTINPSQFEDSLLNPNAYYLRAFQDFHHTLPKEIQDHRNYYCSNKRGFGEDAFHTMWWNLVRRFKPNCFLEIGVYRGQVISLVSLIAKHENLKCHVTGISPFCSAGDSVSRYLNDIDYQTDTLSHFKHFQLEEPRLLKAYSTDPEAIELIESQEWDMIYIDGNHDYNVVLKDWEVCSNAVKSGGIIVLDDSGLNTTYIPPLFATAGHPGPSKLASEIDPNRFKEILQMGHNRVFQKQ